MGYFDSVYASGLPHRAITVYMYLKNRCNSEGVCWPGLKTIASDLKLSSSTVKRAIKELVQHGYLEKRPRFRENGGRSSNMYIIK